MAFGGFRPQGSTAPLAEINMVPLIDVMLVLLVIFMITAPLMTHAVKVDVPSTASAVVKTAEKIDLALDAQGRFFWNTEPLGKEQVFARLHEQGRKAPATELHLHVDKNTRYEVVAEVMAQASMAGLEKIGFVTQPAVKGAPAAP